MGVTMVKSGWNRKWGRGNKDFKKGDKLVQGVGTLKRWWEAETSLRNKGEAEGGTGTGLCE